jgi:uncharacterized glyoxalase superfamily protein PhnB
MSTEQSTTTAVWPALRYRDARAAIAFLIEAFGFEEVVSYAGATEDVVVHAELRWPRGGGVMLGTAREDSTIASLPPGTGAIYLVTDDPDGACERARAAGAEIVSELQDTDYGSRDFTARDPEGVLWSFGTYAGSG